MDSDLNMPYFEEEDLSSDSESQVSSLIQSNAENIPEGMTVSDSIANNDHFEVQPIAATPTAAVSILVDAPPMYFTNSFHVRADQETPMDAGRRRYIRRGRARPSDPTRFCTNFHCKTRNTPMWRTGPMGPKTLCNACGIYYKKHMVRQDVHAASGSVPPPGTMGGDSSSSTSGPPTL